MFDWYGRVGTTIQFNSLSVKVGIPIIDQKYVKMYSKCDANIYNQYVATSELYRNILLVIS